MKKLIRIFLLLLVFYLLARLCTGGMGSVIQLPGGTDGTSSDNSGGWFSPKDNGGDKSLKDISEDLEKKLGIGKDKEKGTSTETTTPSSGTVPSSGNTSPLVFKGIPITGSLSSFGNELAKAGFRNSGSGTYVGSFAGYDGCKITPVGSNPVSEVRVDFPVITDWNSLEKSYDALQASLTQKYGMEPRVSTGSNQAVYDLPNGTIILDADVRDQASWHVILRYLNQSQPVLETSSAGSPIDDL